MALDVSRSSVLDSMDSAGQCWVARVRPARQDTYPDWRLAGNLLTHSLHHQAGCPVPSM
ncbi:hypothetical protein JMV73_01050 [Klebsiella pneumoniae]|nr:hypothetical protein JMV73_01050 [Klebsiella pneumoniae]